MEEEIEQSHVGLQLFSDDPDTPLACKTLQQASTRLKWFVDTHCRRRTYTFQIRKCDGVVNDCWFCALFPKRMEGSDIDWLLDPTKGPNDTYLPLASCIGTDTTDEKRPSLDEKVLPTDADKKNKSHLNAAQVREFISCQECRKRRVMYCRHKLSPAQKTQLTRLCELQAYTCGSSLFPELHELYGEVFVREALMCSTEIETSYYSAVTQKFLPICFYCGDSDILGAEEEPVLSLKKQYSVVRPICRGCLESGKAPATRNPATRNALRLKKK